MCSPTPCPEVWLQSDDHSTLAHKGLGVDRAEHSYYARVPGEVVTLITAALRLKL